MGACILENWIRAGVKWELILASVLIDEAAELLEFALRGLTSIVVCIWGKYKNSSPFVT